MYEEEMGECGWKSVKLRCCMKINYLSFNTRQYEIRRSKAGNTYNESLRKRWILKDGADGDR